MGCDTKGIVATYKKDVREISNTLLDVIRKIPVSPKDGDVFLKRLNFINGISYNPRWNYFTINFRDGKDDRMLWVFLDCNSDNKEVCDSKIILSLGSWGDSGELMRKFLKSLENLGNTYFLENDCGDKEWEKLS